MAASDPVPTVPTPTGGLQGVAAFSWDGTNWQPAGAAYSSVATPTGALRGVAPFSYSGGAWQPSGVARPGVPTPTGTLDGVAVYTWSGSAWTPAGGAPDVPTPSGTLQGVAAFYFDGTSWQPTGQAAPEITTPSGVLAGMAMFSWGGSAWAPTVSGVAVDINFVNTTTLDARVAFSRGSVATYFDPTGTMQTVTGNTPRFDYDPITHASRGLLIEETRTNLLLNSGTLGTQSVATTAQSYALSFYGTGSITLSGTSSGTTNGTGATTRVVTTFTPTAGTLTLTVAGSVTNAQLEAGAFQTSYIPTAGASVTRAVDVVTIAYGTWRNSAAETYAAEFMLPTAQRANCCLVGDTTTARNMLTVAPGLQVSNWDGGAGVQTTNSLTIGAIAKAASTWASPNSSNICLNAGTVVSGSTLTNGFVANAGIRLMSDGGSDFSNGYIRRFRYWPRVLSATELQQVTT